MKKIFTFFNCYSLLIEDYPVRSNLRSRSFLDCAAGTQVNRAVQSQIKQTLDATVMVVKQHRKLNGELTSGQSSQVGGVNQLSCLYQFRCFQTRYDCQNP